MLNLGFFSSWLPCKVRQQVRELYFSTIIVNFGLAMVMFWEPVYLYQIGYSLQKIVSFYLVTYVAYMIFMPLGAKFAKRYGYEASLAIGTSLYALFYISLYFVQFYPPFFYVAALILTLQKMFYWPAYHANFAKYIGKDEEGREISLMTVATSLVYIIGPALAGFIIVQFGYGVLFALVSIIFFASNIPILITKEVFTREHFSYFKSFKTLFRKEHRQEFLAYLGFGEEFVVLVIWPVFISKIIGDVFDLGVVVALATLVTSMVTLYVGKLTDKNNKKNILSLSSAFYSLSWFIRTFVVNATGVFFLDTFSRLGKNTLSVPLTTITYDRAKIITADSHQHIMTRVVFFEMSLVIGKLLAILLIYVALFFIPSEIIAFKLIFVLAGAMTLLYMLL
jgi:MFS family permease